MKRILTLVTVLALKFDLGGIKLASRVAIVLIALSLFSSEAFSFTSTAFLWDSGQMTYFGDGAAGYDINNQGQVVGAQRGNGFIWQNNQMTYIPPLRTAEAINNSGQVVGYSLSGNYNGYLWESGNMTALGLGTVPSDINASGNIVGTIINTGDPVWTAFVLQNGITTTFNYYDTTRAFAINDLNQVVGFTHLEGTPIQTAFLWQDGQISLLDIPGATYSRVYDINNQGQVVGTYRDGTQTHAFLWQNGIVTDILTADTGADVEARAINEAGQIIINAASHAYLYSNGTLIDLGLGTHAYGLNDLGQVVGTKYIPDDNGPPSPNPVPLPSAALLFGSGLAMVWGRMAWDRRSKKTFGKGLTQQLSIGGIW